MSAKNRYPITIKSSLAIFIKDSLLLCAYSIVGFYLLSFALKYDGESTESIYTYFAIFMSIIAIYIVIKFFIYRSFGIKKIIINDSKVTIHNINKSSIEFDKNSSTGTENRPDTIFGLSMFKILSKEGSHWFTEEGLTSKQVKTIKTELN